MDTSKAASAPEETERIEKPETPKAPETPETVTSSAHLKTLLILDESDLARRLPEAQVKALKSAAKDVRDSHDSPTNCSMHHLSDHYTFALSLEDLKNFRCHQDELTGSTPPSRCALFPFAHIRRNASVIAAFMKVEPPQVLCEQLREGQIQFGSTFSERSLRAQCTRENGTTVDNVQAAVIEYICKSSPPGTLAGFCKRWVMGTHAHPFQLMIPIAADAMQDFLREAYVSAEDAKAHTLSHEDGLTYVPAFHGIMTHVKRLAPRYFREVSVVALSDLSDSYFAMPTDVFEAIVAQAMGDIGLAHAEVKARLGSIEMGDISRDALYVAYKRPGEVWEDPNEFAKKSEDEMKRLHTVNVRLNALLLVQAPDRTPWSCGRSAASFMLANVPIVDLALQKSSKDENGKPCVLCPSIPAIDYATYIKNNRTLRETGKKAILISDP
jgi:hypothetical protein